MNFKFTCELCKKEVKRGKKFSVESTDWIDDSSGTGGFDVEDVCNSCHDRIDNKINSMRK